MPSGGTPSGITTSRPAARSRGPNSSSISWATNSEPVCTVAPRSIARRTIGTSARTSGVHSSGYRTNEQSYTLTSVGSRLGGAR